jgi:hypothetical protein
MIRVLIAVKVFDTGGIERVQAVDWAEFKADLPSEQDLRDGLVNELAQDICENGIRDMTAAVKALLPK